MNENTNKTDLIVVAKENFAIACKNARSLQIVNNFGAAFEAVEVVGKLRGVLTDEVMKKVFMPLVNTKIGFLTDRPQKDKQTGRILKPEYDVSIVRDAIIDAVAHGLLPTGNQFNIIAERMYPTKEGYTNLLRNIGVKYFIDTSFDKGQNPHYAEIPVKVNYEYSGEKSSFSIVATVKKDTYSSHDQLRGKAERAAKKKLYEYITGCDLGDADENSSIEDTTAEDVTKQKISSAENKKDELKNKQTSGQGTQPTLM